MTPSGLGVSLRAARARRRWSREALAVHAGVSWSAIAQIESGRRHDIRTSSLVALANALGVPVGYLTGATGAAPQLFEHQALIYSTDDAFVAGAVPFLSEGIAMSQGVLTVASKAKAGLLRDGLGEQAGLVTFADWTDWYRSPTVALARYGDFMQETCHAPGAWVRVVAEAGWSGASREELLAWQRYESLVNLVFAPWPVTIMCTYDEQAFPAEVIAQAHLTHPALAHANRVVANDRYGDPAELLLERH
jgi:transcriptional regulator with XRE-family HTH domain